MKHIRFLSLVITMVLCLFAVPASADELTVTITSTVDAEALGLPSNDELFAYYVDQKLYGYEWATYSAAKDQLTPAQQNLYAYLETQIVAIASGTTASTSFLLEANTLRDWGFTVDGEFENEAEGESKATEIGNALVSEFEKVQTALLLDHPFDFYWYGYKTGYSHGATFTICGEGNGTYEVNAEIAFLVDKKFQPDNYAENSPTVDTAKTSAATTVKTTAAEIVARYADMSDYEKLLSYKNEICSMVDYNYDAAESGSAASDNSPWQLLWVFDGDESTKVVCEGYSKAFQYLCDLSSFTNAECYTVTGTMNDVAHMWNIVKLNGKNYLVDVTNSEPPVQGSDTQVVGADGSLFMKDPASGKVDTEYVFDTVGDSTTTYIYDADLLWGADVLTLGAVAMVADGSNNVTYYTEFSNALKDWNSNTTLTLLADYSTKTTIAISGEGRTLDLNGFKITITGDYAFAISNAGTLTITGGTISGYHGVKNENDGTLTIDGVTIVASNMGVQNYGTLTITGTPTISGVPELYYSGGKIDLSGMTNNAAVGWKIYAKNTMPYGASGINGLILPAGYSLCDSTGAALTSPVSAGATATIQGAYTHEHNYAWKYDATNHWKECSCGATTDAVSHTETTAATCTVAAYCGVCNNNYGELAPHTMSYTADDAADTITYKCGVCNANAVTFTLVIPTGVVYGNAAVPSSTCSDTTYNGDLPVITIAGMENNYPDNAGTYSVVMTWGEKTVSGEYTISAQTLTADMVTLSATTFTYNGSEQKPNVTVTLDSTTLTADDYDVSYTDNVNAGTATVTVTGKGNYAGTASATFTIGKATPTADDFALTLPDISIYNAVPHAAAVTAKDGIAGMGEITVCYTTDSGNPPSGLTAEAPINVGDYLIYIDVTEGDNYISVSGLNICGDRRMKINARSITVTAKDQTITYGESIATGTEQVEVNGIEGDDRLDSITLTPSITGVGTGTITPSGIRIVSSTGADVTSNYTVHQYNTGVLTIASTIVTITPDAANKIYGEDDPVLTYTTSGLGEGAAITGSLGRAEGEDVGEYAFTLGTLTAGENYKLVLAEDAPKFTISKSTPSISFNGYNPSKTYDGKPFVAPEENGLTITGAAYDDVDFTWYKVDGSNEMPLEGLPTDAGTYTVLASIAATDNTNSASETNGPFNIAPKPVTINDAIIADVVYNQGGHYTLDVTSVTFEGLVGADELTLGTDYTATAQLTGANTVANDVAATVTVTMDSNSNYTLGANCTFTGAKVNIVAHAHSWSYEADAENATITATCTNMEGCPNQTVTITLAAPEDLVYDGKVKMVSVTYSVENIFNAEICYSGDQTDVTGNAVTAAITLGEGTNAATASVAYTIRPKEIAGATVSAFKTMTYTGQGQMPAADVTIDGLNVTGTWSLVTDVADMTTFTASGNFTGTIADQETGMAKATPKAEHFDVTLPNNPVYDGNAKSASVLAKSGVNGMGEISVKYSPESPVAAGAYSVLIDVAEGSNYTAAANLEAGMFTISQSGTDMTAKANAAEYTYGDAIIVTGTVKATGEAAVQTFGLRAATEQVALFLGDTQLGDPATVTDGSFKLEYDTKLKGIKPAETVALTVKYLGSGNLDEKSATVEITLNAKELTVSGATAASRAYDGTESVAITDAALADILDNDTVTVDVEGLTGTIASADAGEYTSVILPKLTLSGADKAFYTLVQPTAAVPTSVTISPAILAKVSLPQNAVLTVYYATADQVIITLPAAVIYADAENHEYTLDITWACVDFDPTPKAVNEFTWTVGADILKNYDAQSVTTTGSISVTNTDTQAVNVTGANVAITYDGSTYDVAQLFTIDENAGEAVYSIAGGDGAGTLEGSTLTITKAGDITIKLTTAAQGEYAAAEATAILTVAKGSLSVTAPAGLTAVYGDVLTDVELPTNAQGTWSWSDGTVKVGKVGERTHQIAFTPNESDLWNALILDVVITVAKADVAMEGVADTYLGEAEKDAFTYGETITVKVAPAMPAVMALSDFAEPAANQMALFYDSTQISAPVDAVNGVYTMTYATTDKTLPVGGSTITAKYVGTGNINAQSIDLTVTINPVKLTVQNVSVESRAYQQGNDKVAVTAAKMTGKVLDADDVSADLTALYATVSSDKADTYTEVFLPEKIALTGSAAQYYTVTGSVTISATVNIAKATPAASGGTELGKDYASGTTLTNVDTASIAGAFSVPGTVTWNQPDASVEPGKAYEWTFTPADTENYQPVTGSTVIIPVTPQPPVVEPEPVILPSVLIPTQGQLVMVNEGEKATLTITAANADTYQWYIDRNDGLGWRAIIGANAPAYTTSVTTEDNNGYLYLCRVSNEHGTASSPVFTLEMLPVVVVPPMGDNAHTMLWVALLLMSAAGLLTMAKAKRRFN